MPNPSAAIAPASGPRIRSRKPTGEIGYPLILLSGDEKAGKSLVPVVMSRSPRVGMTYWIDLGEGAADEYAVLEGAQYEVIEHDGSYRQILEQVTAVWHEANRAHRADEPPVVLVVDSMSAEWTMLVNWTNDRARRSRGGQRKLQQDPDAEIDPTSNLWNDANKRHYRIMNLLMTFPGIAIITSRGKDVVVMGADGKPTTEKVRKAEGQKGLAYDVDAWIWMTREPRSADLMGVRSLRVTPGDELPTTKVGRFDVLDLDAFVFDVLGAVGPKKDDALKKLHGDELEGVIDTVMTCPTVGDLKAIWDRVSPSLPPDSQQYGDFSAAVAARKAQLESGQQPASPLDAPDPDGPSIDAHGPTSDAERLRQAAERRTAGEHDLGPDEADDHPETDGGGASEAGR